MKREGRCDNTSFDEGVEASSPSVMAVHVLLEPVLEVAQLMLHSVNNLHGCVQIPTAQTIVDDSPHWVALYLTILT